MLGALEPLVALRFLDTIEINQVIVEDMDDMFFQDGPYEPFDPSNSLIQLIGQQHSSLRRIHHVHRRLLDTQKPDAACGNAGKKVFGLVE